MARPAVVKPGSTAQHLAKAGEFLDSVRLLLGAGRPERAAAEAYYAAFHTAQALLATADLAAETHAGVHTQLARHFVRPGAVPPGTSRALSRLMTDRLLADYGVDRQLDPAGGAAAVAEAGVLIRDMLDAVAPRAPEASAAVEELRRALAALPAPG